MSDPTPTTPAEQPEWKPKDSYHLNEFISAPSTTVRDFEAAFAAKVGAKHAVLVNSVGAAFQLAWFVPFESANRRVVIPACASPLVVSPAILSGFEPVLCEVDKESWGLDPKSLRRICESEKGPPSVVVVTHLLGVPANARVLDAVREEFGFLIIEDCTQAIAGGLGGLGQVAVYSTDDAGVVCTDDDSLYPVLLMLRARGTAIDCAPDAREMMEGAAKWVSKFVEAVHLPAFDIRPTDLQGQRGLDLLSRYDLAVKARQENHAVYFSRFAGAQAFGIQRAADALPVASSAFGVLASNAGHRAKIVDALLAKGVECGPIGAGYLGRHPFWTAGYGAPKRERPMAESVHSRGFVLPNHAGISVEDARYISDIALSVAA